MLYLLKNIYIMNLFSGMRLLILFVLLAPAYAWPPTCPNANVADGSVVLTGPDRVRGSCDIPEYLNNVVYVQFSKKYTGQTSKRGESDISFLFKGGIKVVAYNDRIIINDNTNRSSCLMRLADSTGDKHWLRIRIHKLRDLQKTFISVGVASFGTNFFTTCTQLESTTELDGSELSISGRTNTKMIQTIYDITSSRPMLWSSSTDLNERIQALEKRITVIERSFSRQNGAIRQQQSNMMNDMETAKKELHEKISNKHVDMRNHVINWSAICFCAVLIMLIFFGCHIQKKFRKAERVHLL